MNQFARRYVGGVVAVLALVGMLTACGTSYGEDGTPPPGVVKYESPFGEWEDGGLAVWCDGPDRIYYAASGGTSVDVEVNHPKCAVPQTPAPTQGPVIR